MTPQVLTLPDLPFEGATSTSLSANEKQSVPYCELTVTGSLLGRLP